MRGAAGRRWSRWPPWLLTAGPRLATTADTGGIPAFAQLHVGLQHTNPELAFPGRRGWALAIVPGVGVDTSWRPFVVRLALDWPLVVGQPAPRFPRVSAVLVLRTGDP